MKQGCCKFTAKMVIWDDREEKIEMEAIKPSTILRNYNKVIDEIQDGAPVILTKNGVGKVVMVNIDEWQRSQAEARLLTALHHAEQAFGEGEDIDAFAKKYGLGDFSA